MSKKWTIIADSAGDLFSHELTSDKINFYTVPLEITLDAGNIVDEEDLDIADFVDKVVKTKAVAKSTCPPPEKFAAEMRKGDNIIVVTISSSLSGTYDSAVIAAKMVKEESPNKKIYVLDSLAAAGGEVRILLELARVMNTTNMSFDEIVAHMIPYRDRTRTIFFLRNISNFVRNGRIPKLSGMIAKIARLKLVCRENGKGEIEKHGVAFTAKKAFEMMAAAPRAKVAEEGTNLPVVITHCFNEPEATQLKDMLVRNFNLDNVRIVQARGLSCFYANKFGIMMGY